MISKEDIDNITIDVEEESGMGDWWQTIKVKYKGEVIKQKTITPR